METTGAAAKTHGAKKGHADGRGEKTPPPRIFCLREKGGVRKAARMGRGEKTPPPRVFFCAKKGDVKKGM